MSVEKTKTVSNTMWILQYRNLVEGEIERDTESFLSTRPVEVLFFVGLGPGKSSGHRISNPETDDSAPRNQPVRICHVADQSLT